MLAIAQKSDYALRIAVNLAGIGPGGRLSLEDLAAREGMNQGYLEQVAALMKKAGIITGIRGAHGGYVLAKRPEEITLASIIVATEGAAWTRMCTARGADAVKRGNPWRGVQGKLMETLHGTTVAEVAADMERHTV